MENSDDLKTYWTKILPQLQLMITGASSNKNNLRKKLTYLDHYIRHTAYPNIDRAMDHIYSLINDIMDTRK